MTLEYRRGAFELRGVEDDGTFAGYASLFETTDSYGDRTMPGCFRKSLARHRKSGRLPALLWQHRPDQPLGVWTKMKEDRRGLYAEGRLLLEVKKAREAHALLKAGGISGLSIGFRTVKAVWNKIDKVRELLEVDLWEVSLVTFPALGDARVDRVKSAAPVIEDEINMLRAAIQTRAALMKLL